MKVSRYLIYALKDKEYYVYVGQSSTYLCRPYQHLTNSDERFGPHNEVEIIEELDRAEDLNTRELWWIYHLAARGHPLENKEIKRENGNRKIGIQERAKGRGTVPDKSREMRVKAGLTQELAAERIGVGLRFLKDMELGKKTCRMDKVNQVLNFFGFELGPVPIEYEAEL